MPEAAVVNVLELLSPVLGGQLAFLGLETVSGVLAIVLGFGALVFVHELGHFMAAKWAGVRVEVFSLGFGPRLFGFTRGHTDYIVSALPLGGYVKMLGQDDSDPTLPRTDSPDDFRNKTVFKRMVILVAGVVMNTIFALIAFIGAFAIGVESTAPEVGFVEPNRAANRARIVGEATGQLQGLQRGDRILSINGSEILGWEDIQTSAGLSGGRSLIDIARPTSSGTPQRLTLEATPDRGDDDPIPRLGISPLYIVREFADDSPAKNSGLVDGDEVVDVAPVGSDWAFARWGTARVVSPEQLLEIIAHDNPGHPLRVKVRRRTFDEEGQPRPDPPKLLEVEVTPVARPVYGVGITFAPDARVLGVTKDSPARGVLETGDFVVSIDGNAVTADNLRDVIRRVGDARAGSPATIVFERTVAGKAERREAKVALQKHPNDEGWFLGIKYAAQRIAAVAPGSPAAKAGIAPGDIATTVWTEKFLGIKYRGAQVVEGPAAMRQLASDLRDQPFQLGWEKPDGSELTAVVVAQPSGESEGELAIKFGPRPILLRRGALAACTLGLKRTLMMFKQLVQTIRALSVREVSTRELGGPIQIATITYKIAQVGFGKLLYFLAILSVNLAVLNILPIPVLDGGHLFLLTIEKLKGRPLSDDVLRYVQYGGLLFVVGLMLYVTFNDIRRWFE
jgi:regulator of sigma E protease